MKKIQNIIIGFFAVMGFIIFTTSLSSKSESIYVPHNDGGVLNTQTGMVYYHNRNLENKYMDDSKIVHEFIEISYINKSLKKDTLHFSDKNKFGKGEFFISK